MICSIIPKGSTVYFAGHAHTLAREVELPCSRVVKPIQKPEKPKPLRVATALVIAGMQFAHEHRQESILHCLADTFYLEVTCYTGKRSVWRASRALSAEEVRVWLRGVELEKEMAWTLPISDRQKGGKA